MNKHKFEKITDDILVLKFPFEGDVFTTVFALLDKNGCIIVDSGTHKEDAENIIIPALKSQALEPAYIACTHSHSDHIGGMPYLTASYPNTKYLDAKNAGQILFNRYKLLNLNGHSDDCLGIYDIKAKALITGDAVQQYGVGRFKTYIPDKIAYFNTLKEIENLNPDILICSHDYDPCGMIIKGEQALKQCLAVSRQAVETAK